MTRSLRLFSAGQPWYLSQQTYWVYRRRKHTRAPEGVLTDRSGRNSGDQSGSDRARLAHLGRLLEGIGQELQRLSREIV